MSQAIDINEPIGNLKKLLEPRLQCSLDAHEICLQDIQVNRKVMADLNSYKRSFLLCPRLSLFMEFTHELHIATYKINLMSTSLSSNHLICTCKFSMNNIKKLRGIMFYKGGDDTPLPKREKNTSER